MGEIPQCVGINERKDESASAAGKKPPDSQDGQFQESKVNAAACSALHRDAQGLGMYTSAQWGLGDARHRGNDSGH